MIERNPNKGGCPISHHNNQRVDESTLEPRQIFDLPALEINPMLPAGKTKDELFGSGEPRHSHETMARFPFGRIAMHVVTVRTHEGALEVLRNKDDAFSQKFTPQNSFYQRFLREPNNGGPWAYDLPELRDVRSIMGAGFRPPKVEEHTNYIQEVCQQTLEALQRHGEPGHIDVAEYARATAMRVAAKFVGIDDINRYGPKFTEWIRKFNTARSLAALPQQPGKRYGLRRIVDERMRNPTDADDLLNSLIRNYREGGQIGKRPMRRNDITGLVWSAFAATADTVSTAAVNTILFSGQIPGVLEAMRNNPPLVKAATDESLRYYPPFPHPFEKVIAKTTIDGEELTEDQWVRVSLGSAHRDPSVFSEPHLFNVNRTEHIRYNLAFGAGPHRCLGMHLGNTLTRHIVGALVDTIHVKPGNPETYERIASPIVHRIDSAPMSYSN